MPSEDLSAGTPHCDRQECDSEGRWYWWNGMGAFGPYCDDHAREELDDDDRCPITRREDVSGVYVIPAGIQPVDSQFPTIRTKDAFDTHLETDGEEPHQCTVGWCSKLEDECGHEGENPLVTDGGISHSQIPYQRDGQDVIGIGAYRVLETFDEAADGVYESLRKDIRGKMKRALQDFPELAHRTVTVGRLDPDESARGRAEFYNYMVYYPVNDTTSFQTVYHELAHLAIHTLNERGEDVPITSEPFCSIFAVARMPPDLIFRDDISYLGEPDAPKDEWPDICQRALEYREDHRNYIQKCKEWLGI